MKEEEKLDNLGYPEHCMHSSPIIGNEQEYQKDTLVNRQKRLKILMTFFHRLFDANFSNFPVTLAEEDTQIFILQFTT